MPSLDLAEFNEVLAGADHVDIKTVEGAVTLRQFLAAMLSYQPAWLTFLYRLRKSFVRFVGLKQTGVPQAGLPRLQPETVPMQPGDKAAFFTVRMAQENRYWLAETSDRHLSAALGVVVRPLATRPGHNQFQVVTISDAFKLFMH